MTDPAVPTPAREDAANPYRPPGAPLTAELPETLATLPQRLRSQSTWRLLGLFILTYGIYGAHYVKRQSGILDRHLGPGSRIGSGLPGFLLVANYLGAAILLAFLVSAPSEPLEVLGRVVDFTANVGFLVWGFAARRRANALFQAKQGDAAWLHGFWTFLFSPFYFNYKINRLTRPDAGTAWTGARS